MPDAFTANYRPIACRSPISGTWESPVFHLLGFRFGFIAEQPIEGITDFTRGSSGLR